MPVFCFKFRNSYLSSLDLNIICVGKIVIYSGSDGSLKMIDVVL